MEKPDSPASQNYQELLVFLVIILILGGGYVGVSLWWNDAMRAQHVTEANAAAAAMPVHRHPVRSVRKLTNGNAAIVPLGKGESTINLWADLNFRKEIESIGDLIHAKYLFVTLRGTRVSVVSHAGMGSDCVEVRVLEGPHQGKIVWVKDYMLE